MSKIKLVYPGDDKYREMCRPYELTCGFNDGSDIHLAVYERGDYLAVYTYCESDYLWGTGFLLCTLDALMIADAVENGCTAQNEAIFDLLQKEAMELGFPSELNSRVLYGVDLMEGVENLLFECINEKAPYSGEIVQVVYGDLDDDDWHEGNSSSYMFSCEEAALRWVMERGLDSHVRLYLDYYTNGKADGTRDDATIYPPHTYGNCDDRWLYKDFRGRKYELHPDGTTSVWSYTWNMLVGNKLSDSIPREVLEYLKSRGY